MKNLALGKHSGLVVRGIGGEKKSFKRFERGFDRASTLGATSLSHKYQTRMKSLALGKHSSLVVCGMGGEKKSFKRFARGFEMSK